MVKNISIYQDLITFSKTSTLKNKNKVRKYPKSIIDFYFYRHGSYRSCTK